MECISKPILVLIFDIVTIANTPLPNGNRLSHTNNNHRNPPHQYQRQKGPGLNKRIKLIWRIMYRVEVIVYAVEFGIHVLEWNGVEHKVLRAIGENGGCGDNVAGLGG